MDTEQVFIQEMTLPYSAVAASSHIRLDRILTLFQDAAALHAMQLGISGHDLEKIGLKWVVSRYQIQVRETLQLGQPFVMKTWRLPWKNLYELRRFTIVSASDIPAISALGVWVMVKAQNSKPVRLTPYMPESLMLRSAPAPDMWANTPDLSVYDHEKKFCTQMHDLDLNQHVNNTVYVTWAMETLPMSWLFAHTPRALVVSYHKECFYPDKIIVRTKVWDENASVKSCHAIFHETSGKKLASLTINWEKTSHGPV
ncbi:MAG: acyl-ACP thioesterase domain-containing protein [Desulfotignum sp.]|jgi:medium-chain acyl-[acyl-carrier-protein] hydrolase|nr:acyl-ACP thioesterase domain-containing protein [Desulfotignum sp.]